MSNITFPSREAMRHLRVPFTRADAVLILGFLALLVIVTYVGAGLFVPFVPNIAEPPPINLDPRYLPYYLARSTMRMFIALFFSLIFTFVYGYIAANSRRAEKVMIPLLDILQSVPVLGFLSVTITGFIALFRGSLLGLEAASIFAIFTAQVWNMTFSFYQSMRMAPNELREATAIYRLPRWQRFVKLEAPNSAIGLVWNMMMSFGGGWFFVAASETIVVLNHQYVLPGIGSYVTEAIAQQDLRAIVAAIIAMAIMILLMDQLVWRPLIAWTNKFKYEQSGGQDAPRSWLLDLFRRAQLPARISRLLAPFGEMVNQRLSGTARGGQNTEMPRAARPPWRYADLAFNLVVGLVVFGCVLFLLQFIFSEVGVEEVIETFGLGLATLLRVVILVVGSTLIFVPLGVAIGFNPRLSRIIQPFAQFMASFPANFLYPFITLFLITYSISLNVASILLMALGAVWYVLFNVIAGAQSVPSDLREMTANMGVRGWQLWKRLILPAIFSAWVTGGITASGGAWNASIVAETVSWGDVTLTAVGLGAYIRAATEQGDWPRIALGVGMMSLFVVGFNRLLWRRLYLLAEKKFTLG